MLGNVSQSANLVEPLTAIAHAVIALYVARGVLMGR